MFQKYDSIANDEIFLRFDFFQNDEISLANSTCSQIKDFHQIHHMCISLCEIRKCFEFADTYADANSEKLESNRKSVRDLITTEYSKAFKHNESVLQGVKEINFALMNELFEKAICEHTHIDSKYAYFLIEDYFGNVTCESESSSWGFDFFDLAVDYIKMKPAVLFLRTLKTYSDTEEGVKDFLKDAQDYKLTGRARWLIGSNKVNIFHPEQIGVEEDNYNLTKLDQFYLDGIKYKKKIHYSGNSYLLSVIIWSQTRIEIQMDEEYARLVSDINRNTENDLDRYNEENDLSHPLAFLESSIMHTEFLEFPDF